MNDGIELFVDREGKLVIRVADLELRLTKAEVSDLREKMYEHWKTMPW